MRMNSFSRRPPVMDTPVTPATQRIDDVPPVAH
jgi:hypothetical protein